MCTMSRLLTDGARKWLAAVSHATVKPGNADETRDDLSDGHLYHPRAVKQVGILLMGIIGDGMNFPIGRKRTADGALENLRRAVPEIDDSGASSRHIRVLGQFQINKKLTSKQTQQTQQQTFPSFPHNLHFFPTAKPNATYIFVLILANDELFEFCVSCGEFGGNMKVFVEFVLRLIFVDLKLSQNPYMPTTDAQFSVREILKFATSF